jgi:protein gp37
MAGKSNIEWTGFTWNPLAGCTVLTPGCKRCYAMKMAARLERMGQTLYAGLTKPSNAGPVWTGVMRQAPEHVLLAPLKRRKPTTYFVNSMSDLFHENVPDEWIDAVFAVMALCPHHTFQILTKRADRMALYCAHATIRERLCAAMWALSNRRTDHIHGGYPLGNVWLGVSTERQQEADQRIPWLLKTPAAIRFISAEPLLGPIRLDRLIREEFGNAFVDDALTGFISNGCGGTYRAKLDWVIAGAESGHGARDCSVDWVRAMKDQCVVAGVPFFWKQHAKNGKKIPTPELDGRQWIEMPRIAA